MVTTLTKHYEARTCADLLARLDELENLPSNTPTMPPLFATEADRTAFNERHHREHIPAGDGGEMRKARQALKGTGKLLIRRIFSHSGVRSVTGE